MVAITIIVAAVLAGFLLALAATVDAHPLLPRDPFSPLCDDAPPIHPPVTEERTHEENTAAH